MSSVNPLSGPRHDASDGVIDRGVRGIVAPLSALSFWIAIAMPAIYLPLLVTGIETTDGLTTFLGLLGLHVVALIGGQLYG